MMDRIKLFLFAINVALTYAEWSYNGANGPRFWGKKYPICDNRRQSPVNIEEGAIVVDNRLTSFHFHGYNSTRTLQNLTVWNDGYTVTVRLHSNISIEGGGLTGQYSLEHFHFHWGSSDDAGSEHVIDGNSYPLEMHLVHKNQRHRKISKALADPSGLAVLGVFIKIGKYNRYLQNILNGLERLDIGKLYLLFGNIVKVDRDTDRYEPIRHQNLWVLFWDELSSDWSNIPPFAIRNILPVDRDTYYRYQGSLTTPPCSESVVWTVFKQPIEISERQMSRVRRLSMISNITNNYRPVQGLNGRVVYLRKISGEGETAVFNTSVGAVDTSSDFKEWFTEPGDGGLVNVSSAFNMFLGALFFFFIR